MFPGFGISLDIVGVGVGIGPELETPKERS